MDNNAPIIFEGAQRITVDDKGRIKLPASWLRAYQQHCDEDEKLITCKGKNGIDFVPASRFEAYKERRLNEARDKNAIKKKINYSKMPLDVDKSGRLKFDQDLGATSKISKLAYICGFDDYFEMLAYEKWLDMMSDDDDAE